MAAQDCALQWELCTFSVLVLMISHHGIQWRMKLNRSCEVSVHKGWFKYQSQHNVTSLVVLGGTIM